MVIGIELALEVYAKVQFDEGQVILLYSIISFFALVRAILSLNLDLTLGGRAKWKLLFTFTAWSIVAFVTGAYASVSAAQLINNQVFPIISMLAYVWKSYLMVFITCINFVTAIILFHKLASAIQVDTVEWFKRGFGNEGDPPKVSLTPIARNILIGLIAQFALNLAMFAYGSPDAFFTAMGTYAHQIVAVFGISLNL
jgi:hypothetical protein